MGGSGAVWLQAGEELGVAVPFATQVLALLALPVVQCGHPGGVEMPGTVGGPGAILVAGNEQPGEQPVHTPVIAIHPADLVQRHPERDGLHYRYLHLYQAAAV
jgi:hypothetical protein